MGHRNFDQYMAIHNEIMKRLECGEITTEQAKEVNDLAFEKYIIESDDNTESINFFNKKWDCKPSVSQDGIRKSKDDESKCNDILNKFIQNSDEISKKIETRFCDEATKITKEDPEYFTKRGVKLPIESYKDFKTLEVKSCKLIYDHDKCPKKWVVSIRGEWDADPEHGFGLLIDGQTLVGIYLAADVM